MSTLRTLQRYERVALATLRQANDKAAKADTARMIAWERWAETSRLLNSYLCARERKRNKKSKRKP